MKAATDSDLMPAPVQVHPHPRQRTVRPPLPMYATLPSFLHQLRPLQCSLQRTDRVLFEPDR
jgi:hypothetical protein